MGTKHTDISDELIASLNEAVETVEGKREPSRVLHPPAAVDVSAIRDGLKLTQTAFARRFGFSQAAVREWEQGRRQPEAAARVLLLVIARNPDVVEDAIRAAMPAAA